VFTGASKVSVAIFTLCFKGHVSSPNLLANSISCGPLRSEVSLVEGGLNFIYPSNSKVHLFSVAILLLSIL
jgi:hypothetical protein